MLALAIISTVLVGIDLITAILNGSGILAIIEVGLYLTTIWVLYAKFKEAQATIDVLCKDNSELKKKLYPLEEQIKKAKEKE